MSQLPQKIWRALTQGPLIEEWLMPGCSRRLTMIELASP
jgi:uncharacterized protein YndB with AHSA1/START domain